MKSSLQYHHAKIILSILSSAFKLFLKHFDPIVEVLKEEGPTFPRCIIYCRKYMECADIYLYFKTKLGKNFTFPAGAPDIPKYCLVDMLMGCTNPLVKEAIITGFTKTPHYEWWWLQ